MAYTQPRRISASSAAQHVASEMDVVLGEEVGYECIATARSDPNAIKARGDSTPEATIYIQGNRYNISFPACLSKLLPQCGTSDEGRRGGKQGAKQGR